MTSEKLAVWMLVAESSDPPQRAARTPPAARAPSRCARVVMRSRRAREPCRTAAAAPRAPRAPRPPARSTLRARPGIGASAGSTAASARARAGARRAPRACARIASKLRSIRRISSRTQRVDRQNLRRLLPADHRAGDLRAARSTVCGTSVGSRANAAPENGMTYGYMPISQPCAQPAIGAARSVSATSETLARGELRMISRNGVMPSSTRRGEHRLDVRVDLRLVELARARRARSSRCRSRARESPRAASPPGARATSHRCDWC